MSLVLWLVSSILAFSSVYLAYTLDPKQDDGMDGYGEIWLALSMIPVVQWIILAIGVISLLDIATRKEKDDVEDSGVREEGKHSTDSVA